MRTESKIRFAIFFLNLELITARVLQQLRNLVAMNESLKQQEKHFKAHCKVNFISPST